MPIKNTPQEAKKTEVLRKASAVTRAIHTIREAKGGGIPESLEAQADCPEYEGQKHEPTSSKGPGSSHLKAGQFIAKYLEEHLDYEDKAGNLNGEFEEGYE